jgi:hypothetical protein
MESDFLNKIVNLFHGKVMDMITENIPKLENAIHQKVLDLNLKLKSANSTAFMVDILGNPLYPMNLSLTEVPDFDGAANLIDLNFDGLFYDSLNKISHADPNQRFPPRYAASHSEQFLLHESMLNSLFYAIWKDKMPIKV